MLECGVLAQNGLRKRATSCDEYVAINLNHVYLKDVQDGAARTLVMARMYGRSVSSSSLSHPHTRSSPACAFACFNVRVP